MNNEIILKKIINKFYKKIKNKDFIIDKSNVKCVEILTEKILLNPNQPIINFNIKKTNEEYCKKELNWYLSKSLSIKKYVDDIKIWNEVCTKDKNKLINSNYGWCIFSQDNYNQYKNCLKELLININSRRAMMIYTRPSMWKDYNKNGMSDFICTNCIQCFIRNNKLIYVIEQRSCDFIFGFFNDFYWHCYVYNKLLIELREKYKNLKSNKIIYKINSLHLYERHFQLIEKIYYNEI